MFHSVFKKSLKCLTRIQKLYAFERDKKRFKTLQMMTSKAGCKNIENLNQDFLTTDPLDAKFAKATHM